MILTDADTASIIALMRDVAAAEIMPRFGRLAPGEVRTKSGPLDPVTVADEAAERALTEGLARLFPDCLVFGEEAASADKTQFAMLDDDRPVFVIDPVDGTANYASGLPLFGVMIALIERAETQAGFIYDPWRDDTAVAVRGQGAHLVARDGGRTKLQTAAPVPLAEMVAGISWRYMPLPLRDTVLGSLPEFGSTLELRCAAQQYRLLAMGGCHAALFHRTLPWDHASGVLIVQEAGGHAAKLDGSPWRPTDLGGGLLLALDEASWRVIMDALLAIPGARLAV
jgi:fructose-1,6-bisphosphatase/inositol monophosphatase family enzyme